MENTNNASRGQPSLAQQIEIDKILRPFYLQTFSIEKTAELTGLNRKTVAKRFHRWKQEDMIRLNSEFDKGDEIHREECLRLLQALIDEGLGELNEIKNDIADARKTGNPILSNLLSNKDQIMRTLQSNNEKRCAIKIRPGAERVVDKVIEARIKNHVQSISRN